MSFIFRWFHRFSAAERLLEMRDAVTEYQRRHRLIFKNISRLNLNFHNLNFIRDNVDGAKSFTSYDEIYDEDWEIQEVCMIM